MSFQIRNLMIQHAPDKGEKAFEEADKKNPTGAEPREALPGLGLLRQQLRRTLRQAD